MKIKSIFKYLSFILVGLLLAAIVLPFVFKDRIIQEVKNLANENLNAKLDFEDISLSLLSSFPKLNLTVQNMSLAGIDEFEGDTLLQCKSLAFDMNISPLFNKDIKPEISYIGLLEPNINVIITKMGKANYDISKPSSDTTSTAYEVPLNKYEIMDGKISYRDYMSEIFVNAENINHSGKGNFTNDIFDLETKTQISSLNIAMGGTTYLNKTPTNLDAIIQVNLPEQKYSLKDNQLRLRDFTLNGEGFIQMIEDDILVDLELLSPSTSFKDLFTVFPFIPLQDNIKVEGNYNFNAVIKGKYNSIIPSYPAFDIALGISNGKVKYPDLPYPIKDINSNILIKSTKPSLSDLVINIANFKFNLNEEETNGKLLINKSLSNPKIDGELKSVLTLQNWRKAIPMDDLELLEGVINTDMQFSGQLSDIEDKNYTALKFDGRFEGKDFVFKSKEKPAISAKIINVKASPKRIDLEMKEAYLGTSKLDLEGYLNDPLAILSDKINVSGQIDIKANKLDLNEWTSNAEPSKNTSYEEDIDLNYLDQLQSSDITINFTSDQINYDVYQLDNTVIRGNVGRDIVKINQFTSTIGESDISCSGVVENALSYFNGTDKLIGKLFLTSNNFNANQFMSEDETSEEIVNFEVPENIDIEVNTSVKRLHYTDIDLTDFKGDLVIRDQEIQLTDVESNLLSGKINFNGVYDSKEKDPTFNTKIDLSQIKFIEAYQNFISIKNLAPIAKYIEGFFNTTLVFSGKMGQGMIPDFTTLNASGYIETLNSTIKNAAPLESIANQLNLKKLSTLKLEDTKNWFEIKDGTVELKENDFEFSEIKSKIKGSHKIKGEMSYELLMNIPRALLQQNTATKALDKGLSFLESQAKSVGINIDQGEYIDLKIGLTGTLLKPRVKITPVGSSGQSVQDEAKDEFGKVKEQVKDTIRKEVQKQTDKAVDTIKQTAQKEIDKAKQKGVEEAEKVIDKTKDKVKTKIDEVVDSSVSKVLTDSLANKAKDVIKKSTGKEVDDIKDKINDWNPFKKKKKGN